MKTYRVHFTGSYLIAAVNQEEAEKLAEDAETDIDLIAEANIVLTDVEEIS